MSWDNNDGRLRGRRAVEDRTAFLRFHPLCKRCQSLGMVKAAEEVDHVKPLHAGGTDTWDNKQPLCKPCHRLKTNTEQGMAGKVQMFPEWLQPAACHLTIVFGPPGSGKSSYVRAQAKPGDVVIDLDEIVCELSGQAIYCAGGEWLKAAVRERNSRLGELERSERAAWFITTGMGALDREWWQSKLRPAAVVVLDVPEAVCIARINADRRRPAKVKRAHIEAVRAWWHAERGFMARSARRVSIGLDGWPT